MARLGTALRRRPSRWVARRDAATPVRGRSAAHRRMRWFRLRSLPSRLLVDPRLRRSAAFVLVFVIVGYGCVRGVRALIRAPEEIPDLGLPVLPVMPAAFDGVPLAVYLRPPAVLPEQFDEFLRSPVLRDVEFAEAVHWWVQYWTVAATPWFPGFLSRMSERGGAVDEALAARSFPPSLRYLPLIESGYDPGVTSHAGAVGMWQLMASTAQDMGLEVGALRDERKDVEKSTEAALRYIDRLHGEFGSWFVTLAAYNSGPARVRRILDRQAPAEPLSDSLFWALRQHFPVETREFMPKLYGAMWVASRPEAYGYGPEGLAVRSASAEGAGASTVSAETARE